MKTLLWLGLLRHLVRHPWQLGLAVLGIALGVAVVLAVDLANASAYRSFMLSMERVTGKTTHRIVGGPEGVPESLYVRLRLEEGWRDAAPVVTGYASLPDKPGRRLQVLGLDAFAEGPFRAYLGERERGDEVDFKALLTEPNTALVPADLGARVRVRVGENSAILRVVGRLNDPLLDGLLITDISTAQSLFNKQGRLSHIDLILPEGAAGDSRLAGLRARLPPGTRLERVSERNRATADLSAAFSLNLTAMSLLALVVGMFLIYNTMTFSVVQRRALLGMLRALGVTRREIFIVVLGEALLLGLAGTLLGGLLGVWLASGLIHLVTRTIDDLYYVLSVRELFIAPLSLIKAAVLGVLATLVAAWLPAREAAAAPPGSVLSRAHLEARWRAALPRLSGAGLALLAGGGMLLWLSHGLVGGFAGLFLLILGCALLTPACVLGLVYLAERVPRGLPARMAARDVARHLSRTGVAVAALMVAFATTVGVGVMVDSFRGGVTLWINDLIRADVYVAPAALEDGDVSVALRPAVLAELRAMPGVAALTTYGNAYADVEGRPVLLLALELAPMTKAGYRLIDGDPTAAWNAFDAGAAVLISEPLAYRLGLRAGDTLALPTPAGPRDFAIGGIFLDYGSEHGRVLLQRGLYERHWGGLAVGSAALYAAPGVDLGELRRRLEERIGGLQALILRSNRDIQEFTLTVFDRTFTITNVLRLLAVAVAFVGVLSALMALQLERAREFAVLRASGMTPPEIGWLVSLQTGFMGFAAGLLAMPVGLLLAAVLIFVINRRAFGWTLPFQVDPVILAQAVALAVVAALLAGIYPVWRMARANPADALRTE